MKTKTTTDIALLVLRCCAAVGVAFLSFALILLILFYRKLRKSPTNLLVLSLAVSDFLTGSVYFPLYVLEIAEVLNYLVVVILVSGILNITALTYERYRAVVQPFRYRFIMPRRCSRIVIACWVLSVMSIIPPLIYKDEENPGVKHKIYIVCFLLFGVVLPYCYICVTYGLIFYRIKRQRNKLLNLTNIDSTAVRLRRLDRDKKITAVFMITAITLAMSWAPVIYMTTVALVLDRPWLIPPVLETISNLFILVGSLLNPIIYGFMKPDIRRTLMRWLRCGSLGRVAYAVRLSRITVSSTSSTPV